MRATERAHLVVRAVVDPGETVIDATVGNGHDTVFLAECVRPGGTVYGFDIQDEAIEATRRRFVESGIEDAWLHLRHTGHEEMAAEVTGPVAAVMFNLGYLPGSDHSVKTSPRETLAALKAALALLRPGGVITVVCYRGHPGGIEESGAVVVWASALEGCKVKIYGREETVDGPFVVVVRKDPEEGGERDPPWSG